MRHLLLAPVLIAAPAPGQNKPDEDRAKLSRDIRAFIRAR